jgi:GNAT superfamily N-acetyltransferase
MPDMLVKLYDLPDLHPVIRQQQAQGIVIRRGLAPEKHRVLAWIADRHSPRWVSECDVAFARQPVSCFIATDDSTLLGFACYDSTRLNFFGPMAVDESARGRGIGKALLLACLHDMFAQGYAYAIIGSVGPADFYTRTVGATVIPDSSPGIYNGLLPEPSTQKDD